VVQRCGVAVVGWNGYVIARGCGRGRGHDACASCVSCASCASWGWRGPHPEKKQVIGMKDKPKRSKRTCSGSAVDACKTGGGKTGTGVVVVETGGMMDGGRVGVTSRVLGAREMVVLSDGALGGGLGVEVRPSWHVRVNESTRHASNDKCMSV
jgi:hypothetical protein